MVPKESTLQLTESDNLLQMPEMKLRDFFVELKREKVFGCSPRFSRVSA